MTGTCRGLPTLTSHIRLKGSQPSSRGRVSWVDFAPDAPEYGAICRFADLPICTFVPFVIKRRGMGGMVLTRSEFNLLTVPAQHPGQTFTRAQLLDRLHGVAYDGYDRTTVTTVRRLRPQHRCPRQEPAP